MNDAVVIGYGYVGHATAHTFGITNYLTRHDSNITLEEASKKKYIFICLPTPDVDGEPFIDDIVNMIASLKPTEGDKTIIIRSTVPVGFAKEIMTLLDTDNIVSNPEFLSEETWKEDAEKPWMIVVGGIDKHRERIVGLYRGRFKYAKPVETTNTTAELIKYALNSFFSTKVVFANELFNYAQLTGANYETIKRVIENSPWGTKNHLKIVYKGRRGVHGSCLPKDTRALATASQSPFFKLVSELGGSYD